MAIFKCRMCGGNIELKENGVGICDSCGTKQTISNTDDEKKLNLLDRANHFRMQNDFDKAILIYEQILQYDTEDSDIYYNLALCKYGINYVDDKKTNKKIPTINRMQSKMFTRDADFLMAIEKGSYEQVNLYRQEGEYIDKVQSDIMDIMKNEKPYDIFICYKETDENGERTRDSVLANEMYHELINEGYKVFFSKITLEGKLGTAYEPYIFAALKSSKVMVVVGTKKEYLNAPWVRNEWNRFLDFINNGEKKTLIPAYRDMDPYDLPDEFAILQALDMNKLGFLQDLKRGIKKIMEDTSIDEQNTLKISNGNQQIESLLKRIKIFLEDNDFENANKYCERILDIDAENSEAYKYKALVDNKVNNIDELKEKYAKLEYKDLIHMNIDRAVRFGNADLISFFYVNHRPECFGKLPADLQYKLNKKISCDILYNKFSTKEQAKEFIDADVKEKIYDEVTNANNNYYGRNTIRTKIIALKVLGDYRDSKRELEKCLEDVLKIPNVNEYGNQKFQEKIGLLSLFDSENANREKEKLKEAEKEYSDLILEEKRKKLE